MTRDELRDVLTFAIKRAFISQPMGGITDVAYRDCADAALSAIEGAGWGPLPHREDWLLNPDGSRMARIK